MRWRSCLLVGVLLLGISAAVAASSEDDALYRGGLRLDAMQRSDGGWGWPLTYPSGTPSALNTIGPIAMGLARAEWNESNPVFRQALADAGALLLTKSGNFSPSDGYLAAALDAVFGGSTYRDFVVAGFYGPLAAGTYKRSGSGTLYSTSSYVQLIRTSRAGAGNLAEWDLGMGTVGAVACGADPAAWVGGVKAELNEHNSNAYYDVIGLAGALYGLAVAGEDFDPTAGHLAAAGDIEDLAEILAGYQITSGSGAGGFAWNANWVIPDDMDEDTQATAYAILALNAVDRAEYLEAIRAAADWLVRSQLATGGWDIWGENNEVTGEAMWGIHGVYLSDVRVGTGGSDSGFGFGFLPFATIQKAVQTIEGLGGSVHVGAGTYLESVTFSAGVTTLVSDQGTDETAVGGALLLDSAELIIGRMGQGFALHGPIAVSGNVDASTIHINWNDIYDVVTNGGSGRLDATFNYWGEDGPDTIGLVDTFPILPQEAGTVLEYIDEYGYSVDGALALAALIADGASFSEAELILLLESEFGLTTEEGLALIADYGLAAVDRAAFAAGDTAELMLRLVGYETSLPAGGAGGGAGGDLGGYPVGSAVPLFVALTDPFSGEPVADALVSYTLTRLGAGGTPEFARFGVMTYDAAAGGYVSALETTGLALGEYIMYIGMDDGRSLSYTILLTE